MPSGPPQNLSGVAASSTVLTLIWLPPLPLEINGVIRHYMVNVVERHTGARWTFFSVEQTLNVGGLHPHYYYDYNVSAVTVGLGPFSGNYTVQTLSECKSRLRCVKL